MRWAFNILPLAEVRRLSALEGSAINEAKEILAFEVTKFVHGEEEAQKHWLQPALFSAAAAAMKTCLPPLSTPRCWRRELIF